MKQMLPFIFVVISLHVIAQDDKVIKETTPRSNYFSIYGELLGNSYTFSVNAEYAHFFNDERNGIYLRGGAGYIYAGTSVLFEGGYLIGKNRNYFELGIGYTEAFDIEDEDMVGIRAGYRRMGKNGFLFRVSPMLAILKYNNGDTEAWPWAGLSLGYSFPLR
jgi:hypothetical protein